ncbi:hypothetical protein NP493_732g00012 [Ridgeia piscesae]|uniref:CUB domain-containing protein n=1 Tax=Ridgeia piscesae TaxID=27915 RepID=A0AAD9KQ14_RIDPI|nr:hypothetical protein NP493_732g00012 [Ridgeia piscesae]
MANTLTAQCRLMAIVLVIGHVKSQLGPCNGGTGLLTAPEGQIGRRTSSVNYDMTCQWKIEVDKGKRVGLHFSSIDIRECSRCSCGILNIYDGSKTSSPMIDSLCGNYPHDDITSSENTVFLYYEVHSGMRSGFTIEYSITSGHVVEIDQQAPPDEPADIIQFGLKIWDGVPAPVIA